ncbi:MAG TPA: hypothetical protein VD997_03215 [Phycisphaerales bacterium]|nr:hypothetical protein [Phycisphaerales bacterium]
MHNQARVVTAVFALSGFAVAIACGLSAGNYGGIILSRAIAAMIGCQIVGMLAGAIVQRVTTDHEARYRADNPVPKSTSDGVVVVDEAVDTSADNTHAAA